jgi:hypothetical protein
MTDLPEVARRVANEGKCCDAAMRDIKLPKHEKRSGYAPPPIADQRQDVAVDQQAVQRVRHTRSASQRKKSDVFIAVSQGREV